MSGQLRGLFWLGLVESLRGILLLGTSLFILAFILFVVYIILDLQDDEDDWH